MKNCVAKRIIPKFLIKLLQNKWNYQTMYANIDGKQYQAKGGKMTVVGYCRLSRDEDKKKKLNKN